MEQPQIKPRRVVRFRSKQEIIHLLQEYEASKQHTSLVKFCKDHGLPTATFYTWQKYRREGKYAIQGKFIELTMEPVPAATLPTPVIFASLSSGALTIQLHQYVEPGYIKSLLGKQKEL